MALILLNLMGCQGLGRQGKWWGWDLVSHADILTLNVVFRYQHPEVKTECWFRPLSEPFDL
jgi:hypothetical protein